MQNFSLSTESLSALKNALRDHLPEVLSSHLTEAIASAFGFQTHAALLVDVSQCASPVFREFSQTAFSVRLSQFGYQQTHLELTRVLAALIVPPVGFYEALKPVMAMEQADAYGQNLRDARERCAEFLADTYGLGYATRHEKPRALVKSYAPGVEHDHASLTWGNFANSRRRIVEFGGIDHRLSFYQRLPLANGKSAEYCSAFISMPYTDSAYGRETWRKGILTAEGIGWECIEIPKWSWYAHGKTTLFLFRRKTSHEVILSRWEGSFQRWLLNNRSRLRSGSDIRKKVYDDASECPHLPMTVQTWEEMKDRYLNQFLSYFDERDPMMLGLKRLFEKWQAEAVTVG